MHGIFTAETLRKDATSPLLAKILKTYLSLSVVFAIPLSLGLLVFVNLYPSWLAALKNVAPLLAVLFASAFAGHFFLLAAVLWFSLSPLAKLLSNELNNKTRGLEPLTIPEHTSVEIALLFKVFNSSMSRLAAAQRKEMQTERERALVALAKQVAHDIRSPLMALNIVTSTTTAKGPTHEIMKGAVNRIKEIADTLADRYATERVKEISTREISDCIQQITQEKRVERGESTVTLTTRLAELDANKGIELNLVEFKRLLSNLLNNAYEATPSGGNILVETRLTETGIAVEIRDSGIGMSSEALDRMQRGEFYTSKPKGMGLGIQHARRMVNDWGGEIALESIPDRGTRISIVLPFPEKKLRVSRTLDFVDLSVLIPKATIELPYATENNFTHHRVYPTNARAYLRRAAAQALVEVAKELEQQGLYLKIWDAYRPFSVQEGFWQVVPDPRYVAEPVRIGSELLQGSVHSRGGAVDVTLVDAEGKELEMPTLFDDFSEQAHRTYLGVSPQAIKNRDLLDRVMSKHGFIGLPTEWWHFDWKNGTSFPLSDEGFDEIELLKVAR